MPVRSNWNHPMLCLGLSALLLATQALGQSTLRIAGADDGSVLIQDSVTDETIHEFQTGPGKMRETFLLRNGTIAVGSKQDKSVVLDLTRGVEERTVPRRIYGFTPSEEFYLSYVPGPEGGLYLESAATFEILARLYPGDRGGPVELGFSPDGRYLAVELNTGYPIADEQYPVPVLPRATQWVELFDLAKRQRIPEFAEVRIPFLGEFEGGLYHARNSLITVGDQPYDEGRSFDPVSRRWSREGPGAGPQGSGPLLSYEIFGEIDGSSAKLGTVRVWRYDPYYKRDSSGNLIRVGCDTHAMFTPESGAPACCLQFWQIFEEAPAPIHNGCRGPETITPYVDSYRGYTAFWQGLKFEDRHPRYNLPFESQISFSDTPGGPPSILSGKRVFETYLGVESGTTVDGEFRIPGPKAAFRWGYEWDQAFQTITLEPLTQGVRVSAATMSTALHNSCWDSWTMTVDSASDPCIVIKSPTTAAPGAVGSYESPRKAETLVQIGPAKGATNLKKLTSNDFKIEVGGYPATTGTVTHTESHYVVEFQPPGKKEGIPADGLYDLVVTASEPAGGGGAVYVSRQVDAVRYDEADAVDVVLVIDRSGSMGDSGYMSPAKESAKQFVDLMQLNDQIGVVSFERYAQTNYALTTIESDAQKTAAKAAIAGINSGGWTCIGAGMQTAQGELSARGNEQHPWAQILLSDGYETHSPWVASVLPGIPARTDIYTIALGTDSDQALLESIARSTGGSYYLSPGADGLLAIYNLIRGKIGGSEVVANSQGALSPGGVADVSIPLDDTIGEVTVSLGWSGGSLGFTLESPDGSSIDSTVAATRPDVEFSRGGSYEFYTIDAPDAGEWTAWIRYSDSYGSPSDYTILTSGESALGLNATFFGDTYEKGEAISILATLSEGTTPITNATVIAQVLAPGANIHDWEDVGGDRRPPIGLSRVSIGDTLYLFDDGEHSDGAREDGVYGATLAAPALEGSYIFRIDSSGKTSSGFEFARHTQASTFVSDSGAGASLSGTLEAPDSTAQGTVYVRAWRDDNGVGVAPDYVTVINEKLPAAWSIEGLTDGTYRLDAYLDEDGDGGRGRGELAAYGDSLIVLDSAESRSGILLRLGTANLDEVFAYPNPVRPSFDEQRATFVNLPESATVRIYTVSGRLVATSKSLDVDPLGRPIWHWDLKNPDGKDVARGVYIYHVSCRGCDDKLGKLAVIR